MYFRILNPGGQPYIASLEPSSFYRCVKLFTEKPWQKTVTGPEPESYDSSFSILYLNANSSCSQKSASVHRRQLSLGDRVWGEAERTALLLYQAKEATAGQCLKTVSSLERGEQGGL